MSYNLVVRSSAARDVLEAFFWYYTIQPRLADRFMAALTECYGGILARPLAYGLRKGNFRHLMLRKFPYRVVYEISGHDVIVYRVVHVKRKPNVVFGP